MGDNQAWDSCAKFKAAIWNSAALVTGRRERHNRFSFAGNSPPGERLCHCSAPFSLSLECLSIHGAQMKPLSHGRQNIFTVPGQPALKAPCCEGHFNGGGSIGFCCCCCKSPNIFCVLFFFYTFPGALCVSVVARYYRYALFWGPSRAASTVPRHTSSIPTETTRQRPQR